jgi:hypothetical protein
MLQVVMLLICRDGDVEAHAWSRLVGKNGNGLPDNLFPFLCPSVDFFVFLHLANFFVSADESSKTVLWSGIRLALCRATPCMK